MGDAVPSPCVNLCKIVERTGLCRGCGRNLDEIKAWKTADNQQRQAILARLPARHAAVAADGLDVDPTG